MATGISFPEKPSITENASIDTLNERIKTRKEHTRLSSLRLLFIGLALFVLGLLGLGYQQLQDPSFLGEIPENVLGVFSPTLSEKDYQKTFLAGRKALEDENWEEALNQFSKIKNQSHPVQPVVLMHLAKAQAETNQEGQAQKSLNKMARLVSTSKPLYALSHYQLAQSYLRSGQKQKAQQAFDLVLETTPKTDLALGSHYYLGQLNSDTPSLKQSHWQQYIEGTGKGTFSLSVAQTLLAQNALTSPKQWLNTGVAFNEAKAHDQALQSLLKAPFNLAWLEVAKAQLALKKSPEAKQTLIKGLGVSTTQTESDEAIDLLLKIEPNPVGTLKALMSQQLPYSKDKIIWALAQRSKGPEKDKLIDLLITNFPKSDWTPSLSWDKTWQLYLKGNSKRFIQATQKHLELFPNTRSAPKALFWLAKTQQKLGQKADALANFEKLSKNYAGKYYAYRAQSILDNSPNPWQMPRTDSIVVPTNTEEDTTQNGWQANWVQNSLAPCKTMDAQSKNVITRLGQLSAWQDTANLVPLVSSCDSPKSLQALSDYQNGQHYPAIKGLEADLFERYRQGQTDIWATAPLTVKQALYPIVFGQMVEQQANLKKISPFLITAITRQESAYNVFAVSSSKAMGLMQLLPSTAKEVAGWEKLSGFNPSQLMQANTNIQLGSAYLKHLLQLFAGNTMYSVGAYNGGPGAMKDWVNQWGKSDPDLFIEQIPYDQTKDYILSVFEHYWAYKSLYSQ